MQQTPQKSPIYEQISMTVYAETYTDQQICGILQQTMALCLCAYARTYAQRHPELRRDRNNNRQESLI